MHMEFNVWTRKVTGMVKGINPNYINGTEGGSVRTQKYNFTQRLKINSI